MNNLPEMGIDSESSDGIFEGGMGGPGRGMGDGGGMGGIAIRMDFKFRGKNVLGTNMPFLKYCDLQFVDDSSSGSEILQADEDGSSLMSHDDMHGGCRFTGTAFLISHDDDMRFIFRHRPTPL